MADNVFFISITSKSLFPNFYHIRKLTKDFTFDAKCQIETWKLSNFIRLNELKINENPLEEIDLSHLKYLTSLCFNNADEMINFNYSNVKKLTKTIYITNLTYHNKFYNVEELNVNLFVNNEISHAETSRIMRSNLFQNYIHSKLTRLIVNCIRISPTLFLGEDYCNNLLEFCINHVNIALRAKMLSSVTSLTLIHTLDYNYDHTPKLKALTLVNNGHLDLSSFTEINNVSYLCFEKIDYLNVGYAFRENNMSYLSRWTNLRTLEIKKCPYPDGVEELMEHCPANLKVLIT